jgi:hypothetical protein
LAMTLARGPMNLLGVDALADAAATTATADASAAVRRVSRDILFTFSSSDRGV